MQIAKYITWAIVMFFSITWTWGFMRSVELRLKSTVVSIVFWWIEILTVMAGAFAVFHLLWLMPLSLFVPVPISNAEILTRPPGSVVRIFVKSALVIAIPFGVLIAQSHA